MKMTAAKLLLIVSGIFFILSALGFFGVIDLEKAGYAFAALGVSALVFAKASERA